MTRNQILLAVLLAGLPAVGIAQSPSPEAPQRPELFEALVQCRSITDDSARLQCFDTAAANLQAAAERRDVVVVDRAQVRESRRRLFGLALPRLPIFGGGDDEAEEQEITSIESNVTRAYQGEMGRWVVTLEDGSTWAQTDNNIIAGRPRPGQPVTVHRAALGTYMMRVSGQPGVRAQRRM
jgi:hypothetical protein